MTFKAHLGFGLNYTNDNLILHEPESLRSSGRTVLAMPQSEWSVAGG